MKSCFGTKEFSIKSRICKNCSIFGDCELVARKNANKFIMVNSENISSSIKREAFAKV